jgi:hypothetical protein
MPALFAPLLDVFFLFWLALKISYSFVRMAFIWLGFYRLALGGLTMLGLALLLYGVQAFLQQPSTQHLIQVRYLPRAEYDQTKQEILFWESIRAQSPTNRDVLLNLAALYEKVGDATRSAAAHTGAMQVDPNFSGFNSLQQTK